MSSVVKVTFQKNANKNYRNFLKRLESFSQVKLSKKIAQLTAAGYRYIPRQKYVICRECCTRDFNFLFERNLEIHHVKMNPRCPIMRKRYDDEYVYNILTNFHEDYDWKHFVCKFCNNRKTTRFFIPCMHSMVCEHCVIHFEKSKICPYCHETIDSIEKLYP